MRVNPTIIDLNTKAETLSFKVPAQLKSDLDALRAKAKKTGKTLNVNADFVSFIEKYIASANKKLDKLHSEEPTL